MSSWIHTLFIKLFILIPVLSCCNVHMKVYLRVALVQMCMLYEWIVLFATAAGSAFQTFLAPPFRIFKSYSPTSDSCSNGPQKDTLPVDFCLPNAIDSANLLLAYLGLCLPYLFWLLTDCELQARESNKLTNDLQLQGVRSQTDERLCESHERLGVFLSSITGWSSTKIVIWYIGHTTTLWSHILEAAVSTSYCATNRFFSVSIDITFEERNDPRTFMWLTFRNSTRLDIHTYLQYIQEALANRPCSRWPSCCACFIFGAPSGFCNQPYSGKIHHIAAGFVLWSMQLATLWFLFFPLSCWSHSKVFWVNMLWY